MLGILASMSEYDIYRHISEKNGKSFDELSPKEREEYRKLIADRNRQKRIEILKKKGLKEFDYNGTIVCARNKKNADRKAKNAGLI